MAQEDIETTNDTNHTNDKERQARCARQKSQSPGIVADIGPETRLGLHSFDFCRRRQASQIRVISVIRGSKHFGCGRRPPRDLRGLKRTWIPACAGMTRTGVRVTGCFTRTYSLHAWLENVATCAEFCLTANHGSCKMLIQQNI